MKYAAVIKHRYSDQTIENGWKDVFHLLGVMVSQNDEKYVNFDKRVEAYIEKLKAQTHRPMKGLCDAQTGEEIPLDKQKPRRIYESLSYEITEVI